MAMHAPKMNGSKPSFATIAAMAPSTEKPLMLHESIAKTVDTPSTASSKSGAVESSSSSQLHQELRTSMSRLAVRESPPVISSLLEQDNGTARTGLRLDDDQTQISSSSTKPASLDGKSATSGATFALDEKESLRPDDSASIKAAEEEDLLSGPASGAPSSRVGSEAGSRAFRDQFNEINERMGPVPARSYPFSRREIPGIEEEAPQLTIAPLVPTIPASVALKRPETVPPIEPQFSFKYQEPDEKLIQALESPKDRMFLLRLEQDVMSFVRDSTETMIDLPPCNSFCRLLAHKLADYYALTHFVDNAVSAVRLFRTPYCRIPTPLSEIARHPASADPASSQPAVKIMRRAGLGKDVLNTESGSQTLESSINPSKAGSEAGDDSQRVTGLVSPTDSVAAKDKSTMTREEREAKYKETRERIFKGFEDVDNNDVTGANEAVNEASRSSSANEKKKTKKHRNNDDGFEARSKFNAYYPTVQYAVTTYDQATAQAAYYSPQPNHASGQPGTTMVQQAYAHGYHTISDAPTFSMAMQQAPAMNTSSFNAQAHSSPAYPPFNQQTHPQYYQPTHSPMTVGQHSPAMSPAALNNVIQPPRPPQPQISDQQWPQNPYPGVFQRPRDQQQYYTPVGPDQISVPVTHSMPYQYGQLPYQPNMQNGRTQHPLPGSYNRQPFNPQIRAFVPGTGAVPTTPSYGGRGYDLTSRSQGVPYPNGMEITPYAQHLGAYSQLPPGPVPGAFNQPLDPKPYEARKSSSQAHGPQSPVQSSLSKWATPANLPPKPPPPETPSLPHAQHALPSSVHAPINFQHLSNGQAMPSFQNGVYSMPGAGDR